MSLKRLASLGGSEAPIVGWDVGGEGAGEGEAEWVLMAAAAAEIGGVSRSFNGCGGERKREREREVAFICCNPTEGENKEGRGEWRGRKGTMRGETSRGQPKQLKCSCF